MSSEAEEQSFGNKIWWLIRILGIGAAFFIAYNIVLGSLLSSAGLAFFFTAQAAIMIHLNNSLIVLSISTIVASIVFLSYLSTWGVSAHKLIAEALLENNSMKPSVSRRSDTPISTPKKNVWITSFAVLSGLASSLFIGLGGYLGIMTIATSFGMTGQLLVAITSYAIFGGSAMGVCFALFYLMPMVNKMNAVCLDPSCLKPTLDKLEQASPKHTPSIVAGYVLSLFATLGFAGFKFFSTYHVLPLLGITSPFWLATISLIGGCSLMFLTFFTSSTRILTTGLKYAQTNKSLHDAIIDIEMADKTEEEKDKYKHDLASYRDSIGWRIGHGMSFISSIFMAISALVGILEMGAIFIPDFTGLTYFFFFALGLLSAIARFADYYSFSGPHICLNMAKFVDMINSGLGFSTPIKTSETLLDTDRNSLPNYTKEPTTAISTQPYQIQKAGQPMVSATL